MECQTTVYHEKDCLEILAEITVGGLCSICILDILGSCFPHQSHAGELDCL